MKAVLGIGTNIGDRKKNIENALAALDHLPETKVIRSSSVYETKPWGFTEQADFFNICAEIETQLSPNALLGACLGTEAAMGRERPFKNSPRIIDIDLLLYEGYSCTSKELNVPHPYIKERTFVLVPLHELYENCIFDAFDFAEAYAKCDKSEAKRQQNGICCGCIE